MWFWGPSWWCYEPICNESSAFRLENWGQDASRCPNRTSQLRESKGAFGVRFLWTSIQKLRFFQWSCRDVKVNHKESWGPKNRCFWTVVLEKTLESPLDCQEIQPVHPKGDQSWVFIGRTDVEAETSILWPPDVKSWLIGKDPESQTRLSDWTKLNWTIPQMYFFATF